MLHHAHSRLTRRDILRAGLAGTALCCLPSFAVADEAKAKASADRTLFLFLDWFHVKKGDLQVTLDPERLSQTGKDQLEMYARDFNKKFDQSGHGFKPTDVPFGIRIVQEVAER